VNGSVDGLGASLVIKGAVVVVVDLDLGLGLKQHTGT